MSKPNDFDRLDDAAGHPPDKFEAFKAKTAADIAYRNAYGEAATRDPDSVVGLPHPDSPVAFDAAKALEQLRQVRGRLNAVPGVDLRA